MITMTALVVLFFANGANPTSVVVVDLGGREIPEWVLRNNVTIAEAPSGKAGRLVRFHVTDWPNVYFRAPNGTWDWSSYTVITVALANPGEVPVPVAIRVDNEGADGTNNCYTAGGTVPAKGSLDLTLRFDNGDNSYPPNR